MTLNFMDRSEAFAGWRYLWAIEFPAKITTSPARRSITTGSTPASTFCGRSASSRLSRHCFVDWKGLTVRSWSGKRKKRDSSGICKAHFDRELGGEAILVGRGILGRVALVRLDVAFAEQHALDIGSDDRGYGPVEPLGIVAVVGELQKALQCSVPVLRVREVRVLALAEAAPGEVERVLHELGAGASGDMDVSIRGELFPRTHSARTRIPGIWPADWIVFFVIT